MEGGITFFDTADVYPLGGSLATVGHTEEIIGRWLREAGSGRAGDEMRRQSRPRALAAGHITREHVLAAIDASLRRLGTDYVDLYQVHHFGTPARPWTNDGRPSRGGDQRQGALRGECPNYHAYRVARALRPKRGAGDHPPGVRAAALQPGVPPDRARTTAAVRGRGAGGHPVQPARRRLARTGKHTRTAPPADGSRFALGTAGKMYVQRYWQEREFATVSALVRAAAMGSPPPRSPSPGCCLPGGHRASSPAGRAVEGEHRHRRPHARPTLKARLDELTHDYPWVTAR